MCLEFSHLNNEVMQKLYDMYSFEVIPVLGHIVAGDMGSYQYLVESIRYVKRERKGIHSDTTSTSQAIPKAGRVCDHDKGGRVQIGEP